MSDTASGSEASGVQSGLLSVRERIRQAALAHGRDPAQIRLLAVSKRQPVDKIRAAYAAGQRDFGESYAQELLSKRAALTDLADLRFHMIGHLQRNKCAALAGVVSAVHSVDSVRLAQELGRRAAPLPVPAPRRLGGGGELYVFIEVNTSGEASKTGCAPEQLSELMAAVRAEPALALAGLMAIPGGAGDEATARREFRLLNELRERHGGASALPELSIGMSQDLEVAVECGSSWVRVGTDIFGPRN